MKRTTLLSVIWVAIASTAAAAHHETPTPHFPPSDGEWEHITPAEAGWDADKLQEALDYAGSENSTGVVVLLGGKILAEQHWDQPKKASSRYSDRRIEDNAAGHAVEDVASVQKSVISFLAGVAQAKSKLDIEAPASKYLGEGWSKAGADAEAKIKVRHLLSMSSGLTGDLEFEAPAGTKWRYNTSAFRRVSFILEAITGNTLNKLSTQWLTGPTGMKDSQFIDRPWKSAAATIDPEASVIATRGGFATSARDLARFGLLMLRKGVWNGDDLLNDPAYLEASTTPSQAMNRAYGYLWWLNGQPYSGNTLAGSVPIPSAPKDLYASQGADGRKAYIVPSMDRGLTRPRAQPAGAFPQQFWKLVMDAAPKR